MLPTGRPPSTWLSAEVVQVACEHLRQLLESRGAGLMAAAQEDALSAVARLDDVVVVWEHSPRSGCPVDGQYCGDTTPARIILRPSVSDRRDNFTVLHEIAHHLLYNDEAWALDVRPTLGPLQWQVEERIANAFAASVLFPAEQVERLLGSEPTSAGVAALFEESSASATACLSRVLDMPGERMVMLTDLDGRPWYTSTNGEPFAPGRVRQPAVAAAAERALSGHGTATTVGGEGIQYASGKAFTSVQLDVAVSGGLVFVIATVDERQDPRFRTTSETWWHTGAQCLHSFDAAESPGFCDRCRSPRCPQCGLCDCESNDVLCSRCFLVLPTGRARSGVEICENCE